MKGGPFLAGGAGERSLEISRSSGFGLLGSDGGLQPESVESKRPEPQTPAHFASQNLSTTVSPVPSYSVFGTMLCNTILYCTMLYHPILY